MVHAKCQDEMHKALRSVSLLGLCVPGGGIAVPNVIVFFALGLLTAAKVRIGVQIDPKDVDRGTG